MEERHLSLSEAAEALDISERTAYRWVKSGKLKAYKPGRDYWIPERAIREVVEGSEVRPKAPGRSSREPSLFNGPEEERRAAWETAVDDAHRLREGGRARLEELLAAWQASRARREIHSVQRGYLDEIQRLFDEAYDATHSLADILLAVGGIPAPEDWEEVTAADRFYRTLIEVMRDAGFRIQERKGGSPKVEEPTAA